MNRTFGSRLLLLGAAALLLAGCGGGGSGDNNDDDNKAPVAVDDTATTTEGTLVNIRVLDNDSDTDGNLDVTTVSIASEPANGTATAKPDGTVDYEPSAGHVGTDSFTYTVKDDDGAVSNKATVKVTVTATASGNKWDEAEWDKGKWAP